MEMRRAQPRLAPDDLDALLLAYIEGEPAISGVSIDKPNELLESMRKGTTGSMAAYGWGPAYWGYRKCYAGAAIAAVAYMAACALSICLRSVLPMVAAPVVCGVLFAPYYRRRALAKVAEALVAEDGCMARAEARLRREGGVDPRALGVGMVGAFAVAIIVIVVFGLVPAIQARWVA